MFMRSFITTTVAAALAFAMAQNDVPADVSPNESPVTVSDRIENIMDGVASGIGLDTDKPGVYNALFLGDSYMYRNEIPKMVQNLSTAADIPMLYTIRALPKYTFANHTQSLEHMTRVVHGGFTHVFVQACSMCMGHKISTTCERQFHPAKALVDVVRKHNPNVSIVWFNTWGRPIIENYHIPGFVDHCRYYRGNQKNKTECTPEGMQKRNTPAYDAFKCLLGRKGDAVSPVGEAFSAFKARYGHDRYMDLFNDGDHHAKLETGSYINACMFFTTMTKKPCTGSRFTGNVHPDNITTLQTIADQTIFKGSWEFEESCVKTKSVKKFASKGCNLTDYDAKTWYTHIIESS